PGTVRPVTDERDGLLAFLDQQRHLLSVQAHGLSESQARVASTAGTLTLGGLIKHLTAVERYWIDLVAPAQAQRQGDQESEYTDNFRLSSDETLTQLLDAYAAVGRRTAEVIYAVTDLGQPVPVPRDAPWFPADVEAWSVRWVMLHLIEETARHVGHADIVRESIDGATAIPLLAAAEGWPSDSVGRAMDGAARLSGGGRSTIACQLQLEEPTMGHLVDLGPRPLLTGGSGKRIFDRAASQ
ncbi:MAG: DinB family protein, partial [Candidatus Dormiibacterota bacterium]